MKKILKIKENFSKKAGFTLLFAILVSILVLAVGTSIVNLSLKQIILSGTARDSQFAFYAANSGVDCALYWNTQIPEDGLVFPTSSESISTEKGIHCANNSITKDAVKVLGFSKRWESTTDSSSGETSFWLSFSGVPYCANVVVIKEVVDNKIKTTIKSYGYNTCENSPRRLERGLEITFTQ